MRLIQTYPNTVSADEEALRDLDLFRLGGFFLQNAPEREIADWFREYLTVDTTELSRRAALTQSLLSHGETSASALQKLIAAREQVRRDLKRLSNPEKRLPYCVCAIRALRGYVDASRALDALLGTLADGENADILALRKESAKQLESPEFVRQAALLETLDGMFSPPHTLAVAVNVDAGLEGKNFGLIGAEGDEEELQGLFDPENGAERSALLGYARLNRTQNTQTLERLLLDELEKQWKGRLGSVYHEVKQIDFDRMLDWLDDTESLSYCQAALRWASALQRRGFPLCVPEPGGEFAGRSLYYPHMAAQSRKAVIPSSVAFPDGAAVFITGGNHSGKSSYLKALAQSAFLAQLGFLLPAEAFRYVPKTKYLTLFAAGEERSMTTSRSGLEQERFDSLDAGPDALILLNEPFSGLEPSQAAELCGDAVDKLARAGATVLVVTHLYEAYFHLRRCGQTRPVSLVTDSHVEEGRVVYPYTLVAREPECNSYAERIAAEMGMSASLLLTSQQAALVDRYLREVESK